MIAKMFNEFIYLFIIINCSYGVNPKMYYSTVYFDKCNFGGYNPPAHLFAPMYNILSKSQRMKNKYL